MESRDLFETNLLKWWPEASINRDGDTYVNSATKWMWEGWILATTAAVEALRGRE